MKNILIILVLIGLYMHFKKPEELSEVRVKRGFIEYSNSDNSESMKVTGSFTCDGRQHCSQMHSCEEATYFLKNCPNTKMDGDYDGIPCENQWC
jgi:hypothetical protein